MRIYSQCDCYRNCTIDHRTLIASTKAKLTVFLRQLRGQRTLRVLPRRAVLVGRYRRVVVHLLTIAALHQPLRLQQLLRNVCNLFTAIPVKFHTQFAPFIIIVITIKPQKFINCCCSILSEFLRRNLYSLAS